MTTTPDPSPISSTIAASIASGLLQMQADRHTFADRLRKWVQSLREETRDPRRPYPWIVEVREAFVYGFGSVKWAGKIKAPAAVDYIQTEVVIPMDRLVPENGFVPWKKHAAPMEQDWLAYIARPLTALDFLCSLANESDERLRSIAREETHQQAIAKALLILQKKGDRPKFSDYLIEFHRAWSSGRDSLARWLYRWRGVISMGAGPDAWIDWSESEGDDGLHEHLCDRCRDARDAFIRGYGARYYERYAANELPSEAADAIVENLLHPIESSPPSVIKNPERLKKPLAFLHKLAQLARGPADDLVTLAKIEDSMPTTDESLLRRILTDVLSRNQEEDPPYLNYQLPGVEHRLLMHHIKHLVQRGWLTSRDLSDKSGIDYAPVNVTPNGEDWLEGPKPELRPQPTNVTYHIHNAANVVTNPQQSTIHQTQVNHGVRVGDLKSLIDHLREAQVPSADLEKLKEAIQAEPKPPTPGTLGERVGAWVGGMTAKALTGVWKIAKEKSTQLLVKAIHTFYGVTIPADTDSPDPS